MLLEGPRFGSRSVTHPGGADRRGGGLARADPARALDGATMMDRQSDPPQRRAVGHRDGRDAGARGQEPALRHPRRRAAAGAGRRPAEPR